MRPCFCCQGHVGTVLAHTCHILSDQQGLSAAESWGWQLAPCCLSEMWPIWGHGLVGERPRYIWTTKSHTQRQKQIYSALFTPVSVSHFFAVSQPSCIFRAPTQSSCVWKAWYYFKIPLSLWCPYLSHCSGLQLWQNGIGLQQAADAEWNDRNWESLGDVNDWTVSILQMSFWVLVTFKMWGNTFFCPACCCTQSLHWKHNVTVSNQFFYYHFIIEVVSEWVSGLFYTCWAICLIYLLFPSL